MDRGSPDAPEPPEPKEFWLTDGINIVQVKE